MSYPEPPQGVFAPSMDMSMSAESYQYLRPQPEAYSSAMGFDSNTLYADASYPGMYPEDGETTRVPSSNLSATSACSSIMGSPLSNHGQISHAHEWVAPHGGSPGIVGQSEYFSSGHDYPFAGPEIEFNQFEYPNPKAGYVDPNLIGPDLNRPMSLPYESAYPQPSAYPASPALSPSPQLRTASASPFMHSGPYQQYSPYAAPVLGGAQGRRPSDVSFQSGYSAEQAYSGDEANKEKHRCPHPDCGKTFKDLKAHMLTHQTERPEKCPIQTCDYHIKGFARKYDKNRHTLTHYKGTMVCGFCPGSGSAAEKSFNRADVFKRHLTAVHGVEQTPPNSRKKTANGANSGKKLTGYAPDATGKCSTCSATFSNAQDFYEHLDDCVLRIVQQEDPAEAINAKRLAEVEHDREVYDTLEKNQLPTTTTITASGLVEEEDDEEMCDEYDDASDDDSKKSSPSRRGAKAAGSNPANGVQKSRGMTHSRVGMQLAPKGRSRKNRRDYPSSWGFDKGQMTMRKRVMAVFEGPRRLAKDDMMLSTDYEVRVKLSDGKSYVTDLDVQTMKRAEGFLNATDEEKGPWISDDPTDEDIKRMLEASTTSTCATPSASS